jgi:glycosyltransferase involved in cell wall biosynthesis
VTEPHVSIIVPVHNEEAILHAAVVDLCDRLRDCGFSWELWLAENGSRDGTVAVGRELCERHPRVKLFSIGEPNYGRALREGILRAGGDIVVCDEIDLCDADFHRRAVALIDAGDADMVIGSKLAPGAEDRRPGYRHAASMLYNGVLRVLFGFRGTDTHGLKAFRRSTLLPVVQRCVVDRDVFASELVIRAWRAGLGVREIPLRLVEKRPPSIHLLRRLPNVAKNLVRLAWALGVRPH